MTPEPSPPPTAAPYPCLKSSVADAHEAIAGALSEQAHVVLDHALPPSLLHALRQRVMSLPAPAFHPAGVGRRGDHGLQPDLRSDRIHWLDEQTPEEALWLCWADGLRQHLNQTLFMGLATYEAHFAHYAPGQRYGRHLDAFRGQANRLLSTVLYLNEGWADEDGGELLLEDGQQRWRVSPQAGRLVVFLSEEVPHEVLSARRDRYSIAGWFRVRGAVV